MAKFPLKSIEDVLMRDVICRALLSKQTLCLNATVISHLIKKKADYTCSMRYCTITFRIKLPIANKP